MYDKEMLDFAYRYPFSKEAKEVISLRNMSTIEQKYMELAKLHIEEAVSKGIEFRDIGLDYSKTDYVVVYLYSRMLIGATGDPALMEKYADAEARRSAKVIKTERRERIARILEEIGISGKFDRDGNLEVPVFVFLKLSEHSGIDLINQRLSGGIVYLDRYNLVGLFYGAAKAAMLSTMPLKADDLPKEIVSYSKKNRIRMPESKASRYAGTSRGWIDRLLERPVLDGRHRIVNLVLAPYFTTVKGLTVEEASSIIEEYIGRCIAVNPHTDITPQYIKYQCRYAKNKGLKPLSFKRAVEIFGGIIDQLGG
ncbi:MAG: DNA primase noncatalytic subunit PriX [Candidatus Marsarchaeota archaeon]|nr:DNA primase noncatalytic subunit PriX [Candidatus Marsarchaeota archaeon]